MCKGKNQDYLQLKNNLILITIRATIIIKLIKLLLL